MLALISRFSSVLFLCCFALATFYQPLAVFFNGQIDNIIALIYFIFFLNMEVKDLKSSLHDWPYLVFWSVFALLVLPAVLYLLMGLVLPEDVPSRAFFLLSGLFYRGVSNSTGSPAVVAGHGGYGVQSGLLLIITSFMMIFSLPLLLNYIAHDHVNVSLQSQLIDILYLVGIPAIVAVVLRALGIGVYVQKVKPFVMSLNLILVTLLFMGCPVGIDRLITQSFDVFLQYFFYSFFTVAFVVAFSWLLASFRDGKEKWTSVIMGYFSSIGVSIYFAGRWINNDFLVLALCSIIIWVLLTTMLIDIIFYFKRRAEQK